MTHDTTTSADNLLKQTWGLTENTPLAGATKEKVMTRGIANITATGAV